MNNPHIVAFVGMPGAGKSSVVSYLSQKEIPFVRFGDVTDEELVSRGLPQTPDNERAVREQLRKTEGMDVYAKRSLPKITACLQTASLMGIDGLYSWEEDLFLKEKFTHLSLIYIFASPEVRYHRLTTRMVRPLTMDEAHKRDIAEIESLNKGGPIAMADVVIDNNTSEEALEMQVRDLLAKLTI